MELRNLQATDIFLIVKILNKIGYEKIRKEINVDEIMSVKEKLSTTDDEKKKTSLIAEYGANVVMSVLGILLENLPLIEQDLYNFVGSVAGIKAKDVAKMDINKFVDLLIEIVNKEEFKDFFKRASKLINLG